MKGLTRYTLSADAFKYNSIGMNNILANYVQEIIDLVKSKLSADYHEDRLEGWWLFTNDHASLSEIGT